MPNVVFRTAFAGVVPVCVAAACGGATSSQGSGGAPDAGPDQFLLGVGCPAFECGVAVTVFADAAKDATNEDAPVFNVACIAFDGSPCGLRPEDATAGDDAAQDGSIQDATADVHILGVAMKGFEQ